MRTLKIPLMHPLPQRTLRMDSAALVPDTFPLLSRPCLNKETSVM
jgi:hypothetical protein